MQIIVVLYGQNKTTILTPKNYILSTLHFTKVLYTFFKTTFDVAFITS